jgi:hypothetical protein
MSTKRAEMLEEAVKADKAIKKRMPKIKTDRAHNAAHEMRKKNKISKEVIRTSPSHKVARRSLNAVKKRAKKVRAMKTK